MLTVAILEDEALLALELQDLCEDFGARVVGTAASATEAQARFAGLLPRVLVTDMDLGLGPDGAEVAATMRRTDPSLAIVFVTATCHPDKRRRMAGLRPLRILSKPVRSEDLHMALSMVAV